MHRKPSSRCCAGLTLAGACFLAQCGTGADNVRATRQSETSGETSGGNGATASEESAPDRGAAGLRPTASSGSSSRTGGGAGGAGGADDNDDDAEGEGGGGESGRAGSTGAGASVGGTTRHNEKMDGQAGGAEDGTGGTRVLGATPNAGGASTGGRGGGIAAGPGGSFPFGKGGSTALGGATGGTSSAPDGGTEGDDLQFCVDENNRYRATLSLGPLKRNSTLEAYAAEGAQYDYNAATPHQHFQSGGVVSGARSMGENEIPGFSGWSLKKQGSVHGVIEQGTQMMWDEGVSGGHYKNMVSTSYTDIGCGIYVAANGDVTVTIDFAKF